MTETVVETCADCPFLHERAAHSFYEAERECGLHGELGMDALIYAPPPDCCPLRQGPVTIRLKVRQ